MAHLVETMAYAGDLPWHGLGRKVDPHLGTDEMLVQAGLDWIVEKRPMIVAADERPDPHHFRLVRLNAEGPNDVLTVVGKNYEPVQNGDALAAFNRFLEAGDMQLETAGSLKDGRFIWGLARTRDGFQLAGGDEVRGYLLLVSPHEHGHSLTARFTPTRVVCWNTLSLAISQKALSGIYRHNHASKFDQGAVNEMSEVLGITAKAMTEYQEKADFLSTVRFSETNTVGYLCTLFAPELLENENYPTSIFQLVNNLDLRSNSTVTKVARLYETDPGHDLPSARGTAWGAFNLVTYALDHVLGRSNDNRMFSGVLGPNAITKAKALDTAMTFAMAA